MTRHQNSQQRHSEKLLRAIAMGLMLSTWGLLGSQSANAQEHINREPTIKAAYLYNFTKYIQPNADASRAVPDERTTVTVGVLGRSAVTKRLQSIAQNKTVNGKALRVRVFNTPDEITACHVLFVPATAGASEREALVKKIRQLRCVAVTDAPLFANYCAIQIVYEANRLKFEVNLTQVEDMGLVANSGLLRIGRVVRQERPR